MDNGANKNVDTLSGNVINFILPGNNIFSSNLFVFNNIIFSKEILDGVSFGSNLNAFTRVTITPEVLFINILKVFILFNFFSDNSIFKYIILLSVFEVLGFIFDNVGVLPNIFAPFNILPIVPVVI